MGKIIDFREAQPQGYEALTERNRAAVEGYAAGLLSGYDFWGIYSALNRQDQFCIDTRIKQLLQEQRQEVRSGCR